MFQAMWNKRKEMRGSCSSQLRRDSLVCDISLLMHISCCIKIGPRNLFLWLFSFSPKKGQMRSIIPNSELQVRERESFWGAQIRKKPSGNTHADLKEEKREKSATLTMAQNSNNNFRKAHKELRLIEIALIYGFNYRPSCGSLNQWNEC